MMNVLEKAINKINKFYGLLGIFLIVGIIYQLGNLLIVAGFEGIFFFNRSNVINDTVIILALSGILATIHTISGGIYGTSPKRFKEKVSSLISTSEKYKNRIIRGLVMRIVLLIRVASDITTSWIFGLIIGFSMATGLRLAANKNTETPIDQSKESMSNHSISLLAYITFYIIISLTAMIFINVTKDLYVSYQQGKYIVTEKLEYMNGEYLFTKSGIRKMKDGLIFKNKNTFYKFIKN